MSRRDTILMAVLINTGLLVILFATAITTDGKESSPTSSLPQLALITPSVPTKPSEPLLLAASAHDAPEVTPIPAPPAMPVALNPIQNLFPDGIVPLTATSAQVSAALPSADLVEITIKRGDSLERIARVNGTTVDAIVALNGLSSTRLQIGDKLKVQGKAGSLPQESPLATNGSAEGELYTVQSGDSPWLIATRFGVAPDELLKLNDLDEGAARKLKPGDKLRIR